MQVPMNNPLISGMMNKLRNDPQLSKKPSGPKLVHLPSDG